MFKLATCSKAIIHPRTVVLIITQLHMSCTAMLAGKKESLCCEGISVQGTCEKNVLFGRRNGVNCLILRYDGHY